MDQEGGVYATRQRVDRSGPGGGRIDGSSAFPIPLSSWAQIDRIGLPIIVVGRALLICMVLADLMVLPEKKCICI